MLCMLFSDFFRHFLSKIHEHNQKHTLFFNFARFYTPKQCTHVYCLVLKTNLITSIFFTRIFFFFAFHFSKPLKFFLGVPKWEFSTGKKHFMPGKKIRKKNYFVPSEKYSCYAPALTPHMTRFEIL